MGFVNVTYPTRRIVRVNGSFRSPTNVPFDVDDGDNTFDLGAPIDYTPPSRTVTVPNRPITNPLPIAFSPVAVLAAARGDSGLATHGEAIASRHSSLFHTSMACPAAQQIVGANAVFGDEARSGRTPHDCPS